MGASVQLAVGGKHTLLFENKLEITPHIHGRGFKKEVYTLHILLGGRFFSWYWEGQNRPPKNVWLCRFYAYGFDQSLLTDGQM